MKKITFLVLIISLLPYLLPSNVFANYIPSVISEKDKESDKKQEKQKEKKKKKKTIIESEFAPVLIGALLADPHSFLNKKVTFRGKFSSFTTLALDYKPALRESKKFISICLFRVGSNIPLSELKLAYPVEEAKEDEIIKDLEEGDLLEIFGEVFSDALDEPWIDIIAIKKLQDASNDLKKDKKTSEDKDNKKK